MDFGHWADGGCRFNLVWPAAASCAYSAETVQQVRELIYDLVVREYQGSFSAEHGVGPYNLAYYQSYTGMAAQQMAGRMQSLFDPQRLLGQTWFGPAAG